MEQGGVDPGLRDLEGFCRGVLIAGNFVDSEDALYTREEKEGWTG